MGGFRRHTEEFERRAVAALLSRGTQPVRDLARSLGVTQATLYRWKLEYADREPEPDRYEEPSHTGYMPSERGDPGLLALQRERDQLKAEVTALRRTIVLLGRGTR